MTQIPSQNAAPDGPRIYYVNPLLAGPVSGWMALFEHIRWLGFSHVLLAPPFQTLPHGSLTLSADHGALHTDLGWPRDAKSGLSEIVRLAGTADLRVLLDVAADRVANGSPLALAPDSPFDRPDTSLDPTQFGPDGDAAYASIDPPALERLTAFWLERLRLWTALGIGGYRLTGLDRLPPALVRGLADGLGGTGAKLYGWMESVPLASLGGFAGCGLDYVFSSMPWWNGEADWYWREDAALRRIAPVIAAVEAPFGHRRGALAHDAQERAIAAQQFIALAALLGSGWMMLMGGEFGATDRLDARHDTPGDFAALRSNPKADLQSVIRALNGSRAADQALSGRAAPRLLAAPHDGVLCAVRTVAADTRLAGPASIVAVNMAAKPLTFDPATIGANLGGYFALDPAKPNSLLPPGGYLVERLRWESPTHAPETRSLDDEAVRAAARPRIAIERVAPAVDDGQFPARFCVGETVKVEADLICDGHDILAAAIRWQGPADDAESWHRVAMRPAGNDRWTADFPLLQMGRHRFVIEAWKDVFASYRDELNKKVAAGLDVTLEVEEGRLLIAGRETTAGSRRADIQAVSAQIRTGPIEAKIALLLSERVADLMRATDTRAFLSSTDTQFPIDAERTAARFASWYELFPRSMSGDPDRHGTFDDVILQMPRIAAMGFDVLYFPPIHPIGLANRKGRNNALVAQPGEPGSPYGISDHTAIHPELGDFAAFRRLRDAALAHGLELALDFAIQCSPDHHWLAAQKDWFDWRPDGSLRYAENPPKKYQDIVNVDFYKPQSVPSLWRTLCEVVLFWCSEGIRIFRVDNPHTKPLPFWEWMIGEVQARHPDALFLAEAFTKPKMMNRLAKIGFSQSYTYFTWRNTKAEFEEYLTELTTTSAKYFFRPNFFVNTPDINPFFLQQSGRPGHLIRAALATTLSGLWGMYSGFELCEATPLPGREEYLDSEKYQLRAWDWSRPGNIVSELTQLNWIRKLNPALQTQLGLTFLHAGDDNILYFEKATPDRSNVILIAINLDPFAVHEAEYEVPLWRWGLPDEAAIRVDDLIWETQYDWHGKRQHVRLDPNHNPYAIWRVQPA